MRFIHHRKKRFRFTNRHLIHPNTYLKQGMRYWAKDSQETYKLLLRAREEIRLLKKEIKELKDDKCM